MAYSNSTKHWSYSSSAYNAGMNACGELWKKTAQYVLLLLGTSVEREDIIKQELHLISQMRGSKGGNTDEALPSNYVAVTDTTGRLAHVSEVFSYNPDIHDVCIEEAKTQFNLYLNSETEQAIAIALDLWRNQKGGERYKIIWISNN
jgi:hypothetical protein